MMRYFDLQVNGAFGVDFNSDHLSADDFELACNQLAATGVEGFLPTIITDSIERMTSRIDKIVRIVEDRPDLRRIVRGIHVEGPFLSTQSGFFGTHPREHLKFANTEDARAILDAGRGFVRLVTLAPEQDPDCSLIKLLRTQNVLVFAGHTDASFDQLRRAINAGLSGFTHLGNGCVHQVDRQDNIMQRVLALRGQLYVSLIADGIHVPLWLLRSWLDILGDERCIIVSDSMSAAGMPPGEYSIGNQSIVVDSSRRTRHRDHGYLSGSASTLADMDNRLAGAKMISASTHEKIFITNAASLLAGL
jgi:N-acetylglucosamine-6-phosphate deacetylase